MATCIHCANGDHQACIDENKDKSTGCPGCCQHRVGANDHLTGDRKKVPSS